MSEYELWREIETLSTYVHNLITVGVIIISIILRHISSVIVDTALSQWMSVVVYTYDFP